MIDLHTHTNYSDGSQSVIDLLKEAEQNKIKYLSITDHNTLAAYDEIRNLNINKYYTGKLINGVETTTTYMGEVIEVLAYNFDVKKMKKYFKKYNIDIDYKERYKIRYKILKEEYTKKGIKFNYDLYSTQDNMTNTVIYNELIKYPEYNKKQIQSLIDKYGLLEEKEANYFN